MSRWLFLLVAILVSAAPLSFDQGDSTLLAADDESAEPRLPPTPRFKTDPRKVLRGESDTQALDAPSGAGLAQRYPRDRNIENDPDVVFAADFEQEAWLSRWSYVDQAPTFETIESAPGLGFQPLVGRALQVVIPQGQKSGLNLLYKFKQEIGEEPEEIFFRYYLRLGNDWAPTVQGGKLPGIAGTYGKAGWGGRRSDGRNGWSMRGSFGLLGTQGAPPGRTPVGTYAYHARMGGRYGDGWSWTMGGPGSLARDRWYCIEQQVKMNSMRWDDGLMRVWIDGELAFEQGSVRYRDIETLKIDRIWMNVYHGGTAVSPQDQHVFMDNVVVARRYIGPMAQ